MFLFFSFLFLKDFAHLREAFIYHYAETSCLIYLLVTFDIMQNFLIRLEKIPVFYTYNFFFKSWYCELEPTELSYYHSPIPADRLGGLERLWDVKSKRDGTEQF